MEDLIFYLRRAEEIVRLRYRGLSLKRIGEVLNPPICRVRVDQILRDYERKRAKGDAFRRDDSIPEPVFVDDRVLLTDGEMDLDEWEDFDGVVRLRHDNGRKRSVRSRKTVDGVLSY